MAHFNVIMVKVIKSNHGVVKEPHMAIVLQDTQPYSRQFVCVCFSVKICLANLGSKKFEFVGQAF